MTTRLLLIAIVLLLAAPTPVTAQPCTGGVYADHPALVAECQHNLTVKAGSNNNSPYPPPELAPYPAPSTPPAEPPAPELEYTPGPRPDPTWPPERIP